MKLTKSPLPRLLTIAAPILVLTGQMAPATDFFPIQAVTSATVDFDYFPAEGLIEGPDVGFESFAPFNRLGDVRWVTNDANGATGQYFDPIPDPAPKLTFDLGGDVDLAEIGVWGYSTGIEGNSLKDFSLKFATEAEGPDAAGTSITYNPTFTAGPQVSPRQDFLFGRKVTARYVEMTPLSNNLNAGPGGDRVGFGEVAFEVMPAVAGSYVELQTDYAVGPASAVRTFSLSLRNIGPAALTLTSPVFTGAGASAFSVVNLPASVPAYSNAVIQLQFSPVGVPVGDTDAVFTVSTNTPGTPTVSATLTASVPAELADQFYALSGATSTTDATDYFKVSGLINGIGFGFSAEQPHDQLATGTLWVTDAPNGGAGDYFDPIPDPAPVLVIDLGSDQKLGEISVWGYSSGNANGASDFNLSFATSAEGPEGFGTSITYNPQFTAAFGFTERQSFDLAQVVTARYVRIIPTDNYFGGTAPGGDRVGFGEIAFEKIITSAGKKLIFPNTADLGITDGDKTVSFILKNYGTEAVTISSTTLEGVSASAFTIKSAPTSLPPVSQAVVELEFKSASAVVGVQDVSLRIASNDTANPNAVVLISGEYVTLPDSFYPIIAVTSATEGTDFYAAQGLIQGIGTGFGPGKPHSQLSGAGNTYLWVTDAPNGAGNYYDPAPEITPLLTFDLGENVSLKEISVWGYSTGNSNGMRDFSLTFATAAEGPDGVSSITYSPTFTAAFGFAERSSFLFDRAVTAQYVILKPLNNWGGQGVGPGGDRVGIGEVAFQSDAEIPAGALAISAVKLNASKQVVITFGTQAGATYTIQRSVNLTTWTQVGATLPGADGGMDFTDTTALPAGATTIFYRVLRTTP